MFLRIRLIAREGAAFTNRAIRRTESVFRKEAGRAKQKVPPAKNPAFKNKKGSPLSEPFYCETDTIRTCDPHLRRVML